MFAKTRERKLIPNLEVHVDEFVREGGELIAKARFVHTRLGGCKSMRIELRLHLSVDDLFWRRLQSNINIILSSSYNLRKHSTYA